MRKAAKRLALVLIPALLLSGCAGSAGVENRAYALILGVDDAGSGRVVLTVCIPRISGSADKGEDAASNSPYLTFSAQGKSYADALASLEWVVPRKLSLSHILLLVIAEDLARSAQCPVLVNQLMETRSLYAASHVVVCEGRAADYVAQEKAIIGARLSTEINARISYEATRGLVPDATLADVYYGSNAPYGDPVTALCASMADTGSGPASPALPVPETGDVLKAPDQRLCLGSAVFHRGQLAARLTARETLCLNLALGKLKEITLEADGKPVTLSLTRAWRYVRWQDGRPTLCLDARLASLEPLEDAVARRFEQALAEALIALTERLRGEGLDPMGFGATTARRSLTLGDWLKRGWDAAYASAAIQARVLVRGA